MSKKPKLDVFERMLREAVKDMTHSERMSLIMYICDLNQKEIAAYAKEHQLDPELNLT